MPVASAKIAITSLAAVMINLSGLASVSMVLRLRSFISMALGHTTSLRSSSLPWNICASIKALNKLCAAVIACKSPVKCRLISSEGTMLDFPPPVAPPLSPNTGPRLGSLSARNTFFPIFFSP